LFAASYGIVAVRNCHTFCLRSFSTMQTNNSLQQELLKMQEEINLLQEKLEIARKLKEVE